MPCVEINGVKEYLDDRISDNIYLSVLKKISDLYKVCREKHSIVFCLSFIVSYFFFVFFSYSMEQSMIIWKKMVK